MSRCGPGSRDCYVELLFPASPGSGQALSLTSEIVEAPVLERFTTHLLRCPVHEAAPDLLEALEAVVKDWDGFWEQFSQAAIDAVHAAIRKAHGSVEEAEGGTP